jgi:hypothetical protein
MEKGARQNIFGIIWNDLELILSLAATDSAGSIAIGRRCIHAQHGQNRAQSSQSFAEYAAARYRQVVQFQHGEIGNGLA